MAPIGTTDWCHPPQDLGKQTNKQTNKQIKKQTNKACLASLETPDWSLHRPLLFIPPTAVPGSRQTNRKNKKQINKQKANKLIYNLPVTKLREPII